GLVSSGAALPRKIRVLRAALGASLPVRCENALAQGDRRPRHGFLSSLDGSRSDRHHDRLSGSERAGRVQQPGPCDGDADCRPQSGRAELSSACLRLRSGDGLGRKTPAISARCVKRAGMRGRKNDMTLTRREFGAMSLAAVGSMALGRAAWAAGPLADMPPGAIDCHNHIVGPQAKYPMAANRTYTPPEASVAQLRALRTTLGVQRNVIVQPSFYGFDNSCLVDALTELGATARGIAVVPQDVSDAELRRLAAKGITGVRLNLATA